MRPLFAIAPLALALALLGPSTRATSAQAASTNVTWTDIALTWVVEHTGDLLH